MSTASEQSESSEGAAPTPTGVSRRKILVYLTALSLAILLADQASKILVLQRLEPGVYHPLLGDWFGLRLVFNPGAAFSFATGMTWIFTIAAVAVTVVIVAVAPRLRSYAWATALGVLLGGNLGNLVDRLFRDPAFARGHVVDFLSYGSWFIGNVADIAIVIGAPMIAVLMMRGIGLDGVRVPAGTSEQDAERADADSAVEADESDPAAESAEAAEADESTQADGAAQAGESAEVDGRAQDADAETENAEEEQRDG